MVASLINSLQHQKGMSKLLVLVMIFINIFIASYFYQYILIIIGLVITLLIIKKSHERVAFCFALVFMTLLYHIGIFKFELFQQVRILLGSKLMYLLESYHPHVLRFLVAYPAIIMSKIFYIQIDKAYTYYCIYLFSLTIVILQQIVNLLIRKNPNKYSTTIIGLILVLPVILLSIIMNGRLVPAYLGISIIIKVQSEAFLRKRQWNLWMFLEMLFGFFLTTVSSGTMMVAFFQIFSFVFFYYLKNRNSKQIILPFIFTSPVLFKLIKFVIFMAKRNLDYFGGGFRGFLNMFSHGLGKIILNKPIIWIIIISIIAIVLIGICFKIIRFVFLRKIELLPIVCSVPISLICGLFGFSTALMIIPTLIIFTLLTIKI